MRIIIFSLLFIITCNCYCQNKIDSTVQKLFDTAEQKTHDFLYSDAISIYNNILNSYELNPPTYAKLNLNLGNLYFYLNNNIKAKKCFINLLYDDIDKRNKKKTKGLLVSEFEPFYKHFACCHLAEIYLQEYKFDSSLMYIKLFDEKYKYHSFCGNENDDFMYYKLCMYAKVLSGLKDTTKAIGLLLPYIFKEEAYDVSDLAANILKAKYGKGVIINILDSSINNITTEKIKSGNYEYLEYNINFLNYKFDVTSIYLSNLPASFNFTDSSNSVFSKDYLIKEGIPEHFNSLPKLEYKKLALKKCLFYKKLLYD